MIDNHLAEASDHIEGTPHTNVVDSAVEAESATVRVDICIGSCNGSGKSDHRGIERPDDWCGAHTPRRIDASGVANGLPARCFVSECCIGEEPSRYPRAPLQMYWLHSPLG